MLWIHRSVGFTSKKRSLKVYDVNHRMLGTRSTDDLGEDLCSKRVHISNFFFSCTTRQFPDIQLGVQQFNSILTQLPGGGVRSHMLRAQCHKTACPTSNPHARCQSQSPGCHLCLWPTSSPSEGPTTPSLSWICLINLHELLPGLRETFLLTRWLV